MKRFLIDNKTSKKVGERIFAYLLRNGVRGLKALHPEWHSRKWSNAELRKWGSLFTGDIINVSGWDDRDKEKGFYSQYFPNKASYTISNIGGERGASGSPDEIFLDLAAELPEGLEKKFDVVFNHTTLEHIFEVRQAVKNLCALSQDSVIIVVPFLQGVHWEPDSFYDYWRPTPFALQEMFAENGFDIVHLSNNDNPVFNVYLFCIAACHPESWNEVFPEIEPLTISNAPGRCWQYSEMPKMENNDRRN